MTKVAVMADIPTFDDHDKEPPLPELSTMVDKENGLKTAIEHLYADSGDLVKITKVYKHEKRQVPAAVARRRTWKKYGAAANDPPGPNTAHTYPTKDEVTVQFLQRFQAEEQETNQEAANAATSAASARQRSFLVCRICKGSHFSHQCPNKGEMEAIKDLQNKLQGTRDAITSGDAGTGTLGGAGGPTKSLLGGGSSNRYLPPQMRDNPEEAAGAGATGFSSSSLGAKRTDGYTVRVTNLSTDMQVEDLRAIFNQFGTITRLFPAKDKFTQHNRGFAFISYTTYDMAQNAILKGDGHLCNHVVLHVDWARPSNQA